MLSSLPPIAPRDAHTLWSPVTARSPSSHELTSTNSTSQQQRNRRDATPPKNATLKALDEEEEALAARKANVRRFGATWLRPPGVMKTYQAMMDEAAERAEQEAIARREAAQMEQQAAAEEEARRMQAMHGMDVDGEDEVEGMERDLDGEVPEGENLGGSDGDDDEDFLDEEDGGEERDLDDDVPEAGSYEHTDTEVEDPTSDEDAGAPAQMAQEHVTSELDSGARSGGAGRGPTVVQNFRMAIPPAAPGSGAGSPRLDPDSSVVLSSPITSRPGRRIQLPQAPTTSRERYSTRSRIGGRGPSGQMAENQPSHRQP